MTRQHQIVLSDGAYRLLACGFAVAAAQVTHADGGNPEHLRLYRERFQQFYDEAPAEWFVEVTSQLRPDRLEP